MLHQIIIDITNKIAVILLAEPKTIKQTLRVSREEQFKYKLPKILP